MTDKSESDCREVDLCIHCLEPVGHNANFCIHCRAPLGFLAGAVPFYAVFAEGFIWRTAITQPRNLMTVLGVWVMFGNYLIMGLAMLWLSLSVYSTLPENWTSYYFLAISVGMVAMGAVGVIRCTFNYANHKPVESQDDEGA